MRDLQENLKILKRPGSHSTSVRVCLWYLSEELISLLFFNREIFAQVKKLIVSALQKPAS